MLLKQVAADLLKHFREEFSGGARAVSFVDGCQTWFALLVDAEVYASE